MPGSINATEYSASNGANTAGAISAYAAGAFGQNTTIAVVDSGINPNLTEFSGRIDPASQDVAGDTGLVIDRESHGTAVAAVAAAAANGSGMMGVAPLATIMSLNTAEPLTCSSNGCNHFDSDIAEAVDIAVDNGARVINISLGGPSIEGVLIDALIRAADAGVVVVISAGNDGDQDPQGFSQQAADLASSGQLIIAGAVDRNGSIASFSNWAGDYSAHYLTALGVSVSTIDSSGIRTRMDGTSFSAPVISGAAALLASAFPNLTGAQIVEILFLSADDSGAVGIDNVYGHGELNITRAFQPLGATSLAGAAVGISTADNGQASSAMGDALATAGTGAIILDGFSRAFVLDLGKTIREAAADRPLERAIAADVRTRAVSTGATSVTLTVVRELAGEASVSLGQTGMTYEDMRQVQLLASTAVTRLGSNTRAALGISESGHHLQQRLANARSGAFLVARGSADRNGFQANPAESFGLRHELAGFGLTVTSESGEVRRLDRRSLMQDEPYRIASLTIDRRLGPASLSVGLSHLDEQQTLLGGRMTGSLFGVGSKSYFLDGGAAFDFGRGYGASLNYRRGWTSLARAGTLAQDARIVSDAFSIDLAKDAAFLRGDRLGFRVSQPLRVRSGGLGLNLPVSYDYASGAVGFERRMLTLTPSGRELDFEAAYNLRLGDGDLGANLFLRKDPGHIAAGGDDLGGVVRISWGF